jgi:hypothetical protein
MIRPQPSRSDRRYAVPGSSKPKKTWGKDAGLFAAVLLFIGGSGYGLTHWMAPLDHIGDQEKSVVETPFDTVTSVSVTLVAREDEQAAQAEMSWPPIERERPAEGERLAQGLRTPVADPSLEAQKSVSSGDGVLKTILVLDFAVQDGNVIRISADRFSAEVTLTEVPQAIIVPVDDSRTVTFTGVRDSSGSITGTILTSSGKIIEIPTWDMGQFMRVPVSF